MRISPRLCLLTDLTSPIWHFIAFSNRKGDAFESDFASVPVLHSLCFRELYPRPVITSATLSCIVQSPLDSCSAIPCQEHLTSSDTINWTSVVQSDSRGL